MHYGVVCDVCGVEPIVGRRFKCLTCDNYDLCEVCEGKGMHSHAMVRILSTPSPQVYDLSMSVRHNRRNSELFVNEFTVECGSSQRDAQSLDAMIEESGEEDMRRQKTELLSFMYGNAMSEEEKRAFVERHLACDITEFCVAAQNVKL